jgi:predicted MFS family arabinose efflux permease
VWGPIFAGLCASLIGIGLARFGYTPLLPALIQAHWFSTSDAVYLSAANLAGYLVGAMLGRPLAARITNVHCLRGMEVLATAAFLACAFPISVTWFFLWRFLSGVAGGVIMVLIAAAVLPHAPRHRQGLASGAVFLGLGIGIAASGTLVPLLLGFGLRETWIGLAVISAVLTAATWTAWPPANAPALAAKHRTDQPVSANPGAPVGTIYWVYALMALGVVPSMLFLVDFVARGLGAGTRIGALYWILYGVGAMLGPPVYGFLADHIGARAALRMLLLLQAIAMACLAAVGNHIVIGLLTIVIGSFPPGMVPPVLAWIRSVMPGDVVKQNVVWSRATMVFAAFQALGGYGYSAIFNHNGGDHRELFAIGAAAIALALCAGTIVPLVTRTAGDAVE